MNNSSLTREELAEIIKKLVPAHIHIVILKVDEGIEFRSLICYN